MHACNYKHGCHHKYSNIPSKEVVRFLGLLGVSSPFIRHSASMFSCLFTELIVAPEPEHPGVPSGAVGESVRLCTDESWDEWKTDVKSREKLTDRELLDEIFSSESCNIIQTVYPKGWSALPCCSQLTADWWIGK
jgi:hypothetical protein